MATWSRIEVSARSAGFRKGLRAAVADPLWLLARQWQVGELRGEDAASPVMARATVETAPVDRLSPQEVAPISRVDAADPATVPMESRIEAEDVRLITSADWRSAVAGLHFLRLLAAFGGSANARASLRGRFILKAPAGLSGADKVAFGLMARRSLDGATLANNRTQATRADANAMTWAGPLAAADLEPVRKAGAAFAAWYARRTDAPAASGMWERDRAEYAFSAAPTKHPTAPALVAAEYSDGRLDWHSFDADPALNLGARAAAAPPVVRESVPVSLRFHGMPANRWWEMESSQVWFGGIEGGAEDLPRLLLAGFATIYSSDWFLVPVALPVGSLARMTKIEVLDSFGRTHAVRSTAELDYAQWKDDRGFRFFELKGDKAIETATEAKPGGPWLLLPGNLATSLESAPIEEIELARDEAANLAWAIERVVEGPRGRPRERRAEDDPARAEPRLPRAEEPWRFRLGSHVPSWWIPFVPVKIDGTNAQIRLQRAQIPIAVSDQGEIQATAAKGVILEPKNTPYYLREEEVPREGARVRRSWQLARWSDGSLHLWIGRRKGPGGGERSAGLFFDAIVPGGGGSKGGP